VIEEFSRDRVAAELLNIETCLKLA
jgi:hypothetical protein